MLRFCTGGFGGWQRIAVTATAAKAMMVLVVVSAGAMEARCSSVVLEGNLPHVLSLAGPVSGAGPRWCVMPQLVNSVCRPLDSVRPQTVHGKMTSINCFYIQVNNRGSRRSSQTRRLTCVSSEIIRNDAQRPIGIVVSDTIGCITVWHPTIII